MMWCVFWILNVTIPAECPNFKPDPYTGEYPKTMCAVFHTKTIERKMSKCFTTLEEARIFMSNAPPEIQKKMILKEKVATKKSESKNNAIKFCCAEDGTHYEISDVVDPGIVGPISDVVDPGIVGPISERMKRFKRNEAKN